MMAAAETAHEYVVRVGQAVRREAVRLADNWRARDAAGWNAPSACTAWTVRDVATHLVVGAAGAVPVARAVVEGTAVPPPVTPEQRAERMRAVRDLPGAVFAARFTLDVDAVFVLIEGADDAALATAFEVAAGRHTLQQFAAQRLNETTLHSWDTRVPTDPEATLASESAALMMDYLIGRAPRLIRADAAKDVELTVGWELDGPGGGPLTLHVTQGAGSVTRGAPAAPDLTVALPTEAWCRFVWGRLDLPRAVERGRARIGGDSTRLAQLGALFPGR